MPAMTRIVDFAEVVVRIVAGVVVAVVVGCHTLAGEEAATALLHKSLMKHRNHWDKTDFGGTTSCGS